MIENGTQLALPFSLLASLALAIAAAAATPAAPPPPSTDSTSTVTSIDPVFDCYSANSAWGLTYAGNVVGRDGRIWKYSQRGKSLPTQSNGQAAYDGAALRAKFEGATAGMQVDAAILTEKIALIDKAAGGKITSTGTGVRDAGTSTCHAYVRDAAGAGYRDVELGSDGGVADRRIDNAAPEAKALLDWLHSLGVAR
jgi:hypothetical protein